MSQNFSEDTIIVRCEGYADQHIPVHADTLLIGRDPAYDIPLRSEKVSRKHARIERQPNGKYTVTDLDSANGSFMDEAKLLSYVPEPWSPDQELVIGPYHLTLYIAPKSARLDSSAASSTPYLDDSGGVLIDSDYGGADESGSIGIQVEPELIVVAAGASANAMTKIMNQSEIVEHYRLKVVGLPAEWYAEPPDTVQLLPGKQGVLPLNFHPPRHYNSTAGDHPFEVVILNERDIELGRGRGILRIEPFYEYTVRLDPKRTTNGRLVRFYVTNQGNAPDSYTISGDDRQDALRFYPPYQSVSVLPGQLGGIEFEVRTRPFKGVLLGRPKIYPFEKQVVSAAIEKPKNEPGEFEARPSLPIWLVIATIVMIALFLLLLFLLWPRGDEEETAPTQIAFGTSPAVVDLRDLLTATATAFIPLQNEWGTQIAATATVEAQADTDEDGILDLVEIELGLDPEDPDTDDDDLLDGEELEEGTEPDNPDTDGDGLTDGQEVKGLNPGGWRTDPNEEDSDGDGLSDYDEVITYADLGPDPNNPDRDGDNLNDFVEVNETNTRADRRDTDGDGSPDDQDREPNNPDVQ